MGARASLPATCGAASGGQTPTRRYVSLACGPRDVPTCRQADTPIRRYVPPQCIKNPWLTPIDWPVSALLGKLARKTAMAATSSVEVNSPSTVSRSITFLMTSSSVIPSCRACSGICFSTNGVRTKPGQITCDLMPCLAPSLATALASPRMPCFVAT